METDIPRPQSQPLTHYTEKERRDTHNFRKYRYLNFGIQGYAKTTGAQVVLTTLSSRRRDSDKTLKCPLKGDTILTSIRGAAYSW